MRTVELNNNNKKYTCAEHRESNSKSILDLAMDFIEKGGCQEKWVL